MGRRLRRRRITLPPPAALAVLYLSLIAVGTVLLLLPASTTRPITVIEAFFTSTSAVTVTGLALVDTGSGFTIFGQAVILFLIQIGGLGLVTFAVLLLWSLGVPIDLPSHRVLREDLNQPSLGNLMHLVRAIARIVLICEAVGAAVLAAVFVPEFGPVRGGWYAVFHSVSAFNNAGFALEPDSLSRWVGNPVINVAIPGLFLLGGLGFVVIGELVRKREWRGLSLHSKLMLTGSLALSLWGFVCFAALEWANPGTLGPLEAGDKLLASWFQAVTPRTAGFNTLDLGAMHDSTSLVMILLMLVGGGSASTAGGIKVTTLMVLLLATHAFLKRQPSPRAFGRRIGQDQVLKVLALTTISLITVMAALFAVSISHDGDFLDLAFEVASAFGTVGLSRGATQELDGIGRLVMIALMFMGRVGPLTLGFLLATRRVSHVRYPEGQVYLG